MAAHPAQNADAQPRLLDALGLDEEEERIAKGLVFKGIVGTATYPLMCCKTLIQLGHEPFPLSTGKTFIIGGRNAYFLPNLFSYAIQMKNKYGVGTLFTGLDSAIVKLVVEATSTHYVSKYIDQHYPEIGGAPENLEAEEKDIDDHISFRRKLRLFIRDAFVRTIVITVSRPFTVAMIRQVAQIIGNEAKYTTVGQTLNVIGTEEGPAGLFAGLVPQIIGEVLVLAGVHALSYVAERVIFHIGMYENQDEKSVKEVKHVRRYCELAIPFVVQSHGYSYQVVSTVMAVAGSDKFLRIIIDIVFHDWPYRSCLTLRPSLVGIALGTISVLMDLSVVLVSSSVSRLELSALAPKTNYMQVTNTSLRYSLLVSLGLLISTL